MSKPWRSPARPLFKPLITRERLSTGRRCGLVPKRKKPFRIDSRKRKSWRPVEVRDRLGVRRTSVCRSVRKPRSVNDKLKFVEHPKEGSTMSDPQRKTIDCRDHPSESGCTLRLEGSEEEVLEAAVNHAITRHGHTSNPELREQIRRLLKPAE